MNNLDIDAIVGEADAARTAVDRRRAIGAQSVSIVITIVWLVFVTGREHWDRVLDNWIASVTMVFGSFVAGATPQGGGAVAFPVFTKGLEIPSEVARTFSLCIQTVGMGAAALAILIRRRRVELRALAVAGPAATVGFAVGYFVLSDRNAPFAPSILPGAYVKVSFTLLTAAMAYVTYLAYRVHLLAVRPTVTSYSTRFTITLALCGLFGGVASSQVGSGADVFLYLGLVVLAGLSPRVGVATSVVLMAMISTLGLLVSGVFDGHLAIAFDSIGDVTSVGGDAVASRPDGPTFATGAGLEASRFDLFGLWIAAVPIVAWGAPLGAWVTSRITDRRLVIAVMALAAIEVVTTMIFVTELRSDLTLVVFAVAAIGLLLATLRWLQRNRVQLLQLDAVGADTVLRRSGVDIGPRFREQLGQVDDTSENGPT